MAEPDVITNPLADAVVDDEDITSAEEDDDPEANEGEPVAFDLGDDKDGGA
jgi:hypothetical protein